MLVHNPMLNEIQHCKSPKFKSLNLIHFCPHTSRKVINLLRQTSLYFNFANLLALLHPFTIRESFVNVYQRKLNIFHEQNIIRFPSNTDHISVLKNQFLAKCARVRRWSLWSLMNRTLSTINHSGGEPEKEESFTSSIKICILFKSGIEAIRYCLAAAIFRPILRNCVVWEVSWLNYFSYTRSYLFVCIVKDRATHKWRQLFVFKLSLKLYDVIVKLI